ncbi:MAG TPA: tetratricopeptide repeat protein [Acidobacteriaceae bacterium]|jgi:tetratricopeptide (TPR) repeat protein|nr:tetratricopeptide repeat protein [Acidobacteriaceae bacterium]
MLAGCAACCAQSSSPSLRQADSDYRAGVAAMSRNDLKTARHEFEEVVRLAPNIEQGHSALGAVLVRSGDLAAGIRELQKAVALSAKDTSAEENLAMALEENGKPEQALPCFARLEEAARANRHPLPLDLLTAYARALVAAHQPEAAQARLKEAVQLAPGNAQLWDELGTLQAQQREWHAADQSFSRAVQLNPGLAMAHLHLGLTLQAEQKPGALEEVRKANALAPRNPVILAQLAQLLVANGDDREAIPLLREAVAANPESAADDYQLGLALQRTGEVNQAIPLLEKAAAAERTDGKVLTNLGMALCQAQRAKEAVPLLQKAVALSPRNPTSRENLAAAYIQLSQFDDAVAQLRQALQLDPQAPQLHYDLGLALKMKDDEADAIPEFEAAEKQNPSAPEPPYALGLLYLQAGRYADAERELQTTLRLQPQNGNGWATLGSIENHLNKLPAAASALQEAIRQRPNQPDPYLILAEVLVKEKQPEQAAADRHKAADLMRANMNRQRAEVSSNSGNDLLKQGKLADAESAFRDALSFDPTDAQAHLGLASVLQQEGKTAEAAAEREKAQSAQARSSAQPQP